MDGAPGRTDGAPGRTDGAPGRTAGCIIDGAIGTIPAGGPIGAPGGVWARGDDGLDFKIDLGGPSLGLSASFSDFDLSDPSPESIDTDFFDAIEATDFLDGDFSPIDVLEEDEPVTEA